MAKKLQETESDLIQKKIEKSMRKRKKYADEQTSEFMENVNQFVCTKYGGNVPPELKCSMKLLETYYNLYVQLSDEVASLPTLIQDSRYGSVPHPLLNALNAVTIRLEKSCDNMGITLKAQSKLAIADIKQEDTPLDSWLKSQEKGKEVR